MTKIQRHAVSTQYVAHGPPPFPNPNPNPNPNPLQSSPKCTPGDLGLLILKERRSVGKRTELTPLVSLFLGIPKS